jgi:RNA polymerase sigma factor (sigma-70 family)
MTVLTHGVNDPKTNDLFNNKELDQHLLSMDEYIKIAKRIIGSHASPKACSRMLKDEDAIAFVAHKLMVGTCRWVNGGKRGTHRGYLSQCGVWAVWTWSEQQSDATTKEWDNISLYETVSLWSNDDRPIYLYQLIEDSRHMDIPSTQSEKIEATRLAVDNANLNDRDKMLVDMVYRQDMTLQEVGDILDISRERVRQLLCGIHQKILKADKEHGVLDEYNPRPVEV